MKNGWEGQTQGNVGTRVWGFLQNERVPSPLRYSWGPTIARKADILL